MRMFRRLVPIPVLALALVGVGCTADYDSEAPGAEGTPAVATVEQNVVEAWASPVVVDDTPAEEWLEWEEAGPFVQPLPTPAAVAAQEPPPDDREPDPEPWVPETEDRDQ